MSGIGICHECLKQFDLLDEYLVYGYDREPNQIWECPHCGYPNDKGDCKQY